MYYGVYPELQRRAGATHIAMRWGSDTLYYLFGDHLGSTSVSVRSNLSETIIQLYKAWGETRYNMASYIPPGIPSGPKDLPTTYRFTGQREESSLGLYYYGARWYDQSLGRWIQPDSIVPELSQGVQAWDRYAYVNISPINFLDPTGHRIEGKWGYWDTSDPPYKSEHTPQPSYDIKDILKSHKPKETITPPGLIYQPGPTSTPTTTIPSDSSQEEDSAFDFSIKVDWTKVDIIDAAIDSFGLACNGAEFFIPGADNIGAIPELAGLIKSAIELATGDPTNMLIQQTNNQAERVAVIIFRLERAAPVVGFIGNGYSLYINFRGAIQVNH
jgi:RHS repeat-associated protein